MQYKAKCDRTFLIRISKTLNRIIAILPKTPIWANAIPKFVPKKGQKESPGILRIWEYCLIEALKSMLDFDASHEYIDHLYIHLNQFTSNIQTRKANQKKTNK